MAHAATSSRVDAVADAIRARVAGGTYVPGQRLVEAALALEFVASRGVIREATRRLAAEGVLDLSPHRGASIRRLARADVAALAPIREALEGLAARLAAANGPSARGRLDASLEHGAAAELAGDPVGAYGRANLAFHALVLDLAGNDRLAESLRPLASPLPRLTYARLLDRHTRDRSRAGHAAIAAAIIAADPDAAEAAMRAHVRDAHAELLTLPPTLFA